MLFAGALPRYYSMSYLPRSSLRLSTLSSVFGNAAVSVNDVCFPFLKNDILKGCNPIGVKSIN
jgi:hypothetical protein